MGFCPWETAFLVGSSVAQAVRAAREIGGEGEAVTAAALVSRGVRVLDQRFCGGGSIPNAVCAAAVAGAAGAFVGTVGDDEEGRVVRQALGSHGVDCRWLVTAPGRTALSVVLTKPGAKAPRQLTLRRHHGTAGSGSLHQPTCRVLHLGYPGTRQLAWAEEQKRRSGLVSVDVGQGCTRNVALPQTTKLLAQADLVIVSRANAGRLTGQGRGVALGDRIAALRSLLGPGALLVVTLGAEGAAASRGSVLLRLAPPTVDAVDPTGAGDCLAGHLAAALAHGELAGEGMVDALRRAVAASALSVTALSARGRLSSRQEADAWSVKVSVEEVSGLDL
jgi:sugar/nucleoside kinase (ribokinase family)